MCKRRLDGVLPRRHQTIYLSSCSASPEAERKLKLSNRLAAEVSIFVKCRATAPDGHANHCDGSGVTWCGDLSRRRGT